MNSKINDEDHQVQEDDEQESLSLSDFPLFCDSPDHRRRSSPQPPDVFEFSNNPKSTRMSHAEDIISCGRLIPYQQPPSSDHAPDGHDSNNITRRYCDSLPDLDPTSTRLTRSSHSLDSKRLRRNSSLVMKSEKSDFYRSFSKGMVKSDTMSKPRWYGLMSFGLAPEMDLREMRSRQVRRRMSPASVDRGGEGRVNRRASSWGCDWLRVLSCKDHQSVGVTASVRLVPQL